MKNNTIEITKENLFKYYISENHSRKECLEFFQITDWCFKQLLKKYSIKKSKDLIAACRQKTNIRVYGGNSPACNSKVVEKMKNTKLARYGSSGYNNIEKIKETNIKKYGYPNVSQSFSKEAKQQIKRNTQKTLFKKYGTLEYWKSEKLTDSYIQQQEKSKDTCLKKYNVPYYTQSTEFKKRVPERTLKTQETCMDKYGVINVSQSKEVSVRRGTHYLYDNLSFDSSWELALWIYAKDHNESIIRCPCSYEYVYYNEKHIYIPDFKYMNKIIELKGPQFLEDNKMICPYDTKQNELYNAKYQCMIDNGVEIWNKDSIKFAIEYVNTKYGCKYLKSFKRHKK